MKPGTTRVMVTVRPGDDGLFHWVARAITDERNVVEEGSAATGPRALEIGLAAVSRAVGIPERRRQP